MHTLNCGNSSVGRAQPCQGWGREFESRFPLQNQENPGEPGFSLLCNESLKLYPTLAGWQSGYAAACKAVYAGSIPTPASK